jgi:adenine phosphoribosyltransferase
MDMLNPICPPCRGYDQENQGGNLGSRPSKQATDALPTISINFLIIKSMNPKIVELRAAVRTVPDFPKPGILFRDLSPVLGDPRLFGMLVDLLAEASGTIGASRVAGLDARGFIFGTALACRLRVGFLPIRKRGKLPPPVLSYAYELEYGKAELEIRGDDVIPGEKVIIVDDLLATGGTAAAAVKLLKQAGANPVAALFAIELDGLDGCKALNGLEVLSLLKY